IAVLRQALIALIQIEEPWLTHPSLPNADSTRESRHRPARKGYFEVTDRRVSSFPMASYQRLRR
ncbi:hypothetical protein MKK68_29065, partial [Methylobacterium sp. E-016]|uniref:hypothetical protein n=1 Tax=Methylobacterium sp. E-016 TaxID=2836556 RepID=UPI001FB97B70